jgi:hypothetical protein
LFNVGGERVVPALSVGLAADAALVAVVEDRLHEYFTKAAKRLFVIKRV